jgi:hypothetical protein
LKLLLSECSRSSGNNGTHGNAKTRILDTLVQPVLLPAFRMALQVLSVSQYWLEH